MDATTTASGDLTVRLLECLDKSCRTVVALRQQLHDQSALTPQQVAVFLRELVAALEAVRAQAVESEQQLSLCRSQLAAVQKEKSLLAAELVRKQRETQ